MVRIERAGQTNPFGTRRASSSAVAA